MTWRVTDWGLDKVSKLGSKVLVLGGGGQVGQSCVAAFGNDAPDLATQCHALSSAQCDITSLDALRRAFEAVAPDLIVNCAAMTNVDGAQANRKAAFAVNRDGAANVAALCARHSVPLIHLSTDYVFGQSLGRPFVETDPVDPISVYGQSKAEGEIAVMAAHKDAVILRTSWVYGPHARNFFTTMMSLAETKTQIKAVEDEAACPTLAQDLATAIVAISGRILGGAGHFGIYHCCGEDGASRLAFAQEIMAARAAVGARTCQVTPTTQAEFGAPARRPKDSRLDCSALKRDYNITLPGFRRQVRTIVATMLSGTNGI